MTLPFFIEKLWDLRPRISFEITSPSSASIEAVRLRQNIYEHENSLLTLESANIVNKRRLMTGSRTECHCSMPVYKLDTLDGSDYFICVHGSKINSRHNYMYR